MSLPFDPVLADLYRHLAELDREPRPADRCGWCGEPAFAADLKTVQFTSCSRPQVVRACGRCIREEGNDILTMIFNGPDRIFRRWLRSKRRAA